jgi:hypothetical protein
MPNTEQEYQAIQARDIQLEKYRSKTSHRPVQDLSSDDDNDQTPPNEGLRRSQISDAPQRSAPRLGEHAAEGRRPARPWRRCFVFLIPSKRVCLAISIIIGIILAAAIGGGAWVYKNRPPDGLSPPWYPTPLGGTVKSWEDSYVKAREMVSKMDLLERVNITTGTG